MTRSCGMILVGLVALVCCGCLSVQAPREVRVGTVNTPPPKADCGPTPKTYDAAVAAWQRLCDRQARQRGIQEKVQEAQRQVRRLIVPAPWAFAAKRGSGLLMPRRLA